MTQNRRYRSVTSRPLLARYWFEFEFDDADLPPTDAVVLDGGTVRYRLLGSGAGVTGYDEADCKRLLTALVSDYREDLPRLKRVVRDVNVPDLHLDPRFIGVPAWRGVWYPALNRAAPSR